MRRSDVATLPREAITRGIKRLKEGGLIKNILILGFDCEYDSTTQVIVSYQLSDGTKSVLIPAEKNWTWVQLADNVKSTIKAWGYRARDYNTIALVSHFSTAELSHIEAFHVEAEVRRVSPQQVFNASYRVDHHLNIQVVDQYHFWNTSLAKVAEVWGEGKLEYDTSNVTRESLLDPKFVEYAKWDAVVCQRTFTKFRDRVYSDYALDIMKYGTPASLAMAVYRLHYQEDDFEAPVARIRKAAWRCLWGGRAEAYVAGDHFGDHDLRDVKSLYPSAEILLGVMPRSFDWVERHNGPVTWRGFAYVRFSFPESVRHPCLPVVHAGKLMFPRKGRSDCTLDEVRVAISLGAKVRFERVFEYTSGTPSLTTFMVEMMRKKDAAEVDGDQPGRDLAKLLANSLIGKFSQNKGESDIEDFKAFAKLHDMPLAAVMKPSFTHVDKPAGKHRIGGYIMPEWSALILGKARSLMAELLNCGISSLICSTDSLLVPSSQSVLIDAKMASLGIKLDNKNQHCAECCAAVHGGCAKGKCKKPAVTDHIRVVRNRVYAARCRHGSAVFMANHGIHAPRDFALSLIMGEGDSYLKRRRVGLKTAVRTGQAFFAESQAGMRFRGEWDQKRFLEVGGSTRPWDSVAEHDAVNGVSTMSLSSPNHSSNLPAKAANTRRPRVGTKD